MTDLRKAAEMALYALEFNYPLIEDYGNKEQLDTHHEAIMALCKSLAQPEQDKQCKHCDGKGCVACDARCLPKPEQEPVAYIDHVSGKPKFIDGYVVQTDYDIPLYTASPNKEWVGLTDDDMSEIWEKSGWYVRLF